MTALCQQTPRANGGFNAPNEEGAAPYP